MIKTFKAFLDDPEAFDMYITGRAGTGKTTDVAELVAYCLAADIECVVSAYTHKAIGILRDKMPEGASFSTLHSFLGKRPTVNQHATSHKHIEQSLKMGTTSATSVLFIDEYSMVGEKDYLDILAEQDPDYEGKPALKVVWIGDPYQLPPVGDTKAIVPQGKYQVELTEIKRQAKDNPLGNVLEDLVSFIEGAELKALEPSKRFIRGQDIVAEYIACDEPNKVILAYTNQNVQNLNSSIQGYHEPREGDKLFSPTTQKPYIFVRWVKHPSCIQLPFGEPLMLDSKFKTLEYLIKLDVKFAELIDDEGDIVVMACMFGHYDYKTHIAELKNEAADSNKAIEQEYSGYKAAGWAKANPKKPLARKRAKAWRDFLSFNESAICLDFAHAMTVHKSQGSTYSHVFLDSEDLHKAAHFSFEMYLKLMYVACSRASYMVVTN